MLSSEPAPSSPRPWASAWARPLADEKTLTRTLLSSGKKDISTLREKETFLLCLDTVRRNTSKCGHFRVKSQKTTHGFLGEAGKGERFLEASSSELAVLADCGLGVSFVLVFPTALTRTRYETAQRPGTNILRRARTPSDRVQRSGIPTSAPFERPGSLTRTRCFSADLGWTQGCVREMRPTSPGDCHARGSSPLRYRGVSGPRPRSFLIWTIFR